MSAKALKPFSEYGIAVSAGTFPPFYKRAPLFLEAGKESLFVENSLT